MSKVEVLTAEEIDHINATLERESGVLALPAPRHIPFGELPFTDDEAEQSEEMTSLNWIVDSIGLPRYVDAVGMYVGNNVAYVMTEPTVAVEVLTTIHDMAIDNGSEVAGFLFHPLKQFVCRADDIDFYLMHHMLDFMSEEVLVNLSHMDNMKVTVSPTGFVRCEIKYRESVFVVLNWWV